MIRLERINDEVFYAREHPVVLGSDEIEFLKSRAAATPRRRARICTHPAVEAALHEMFIVHHATAYVRPHAHAKKAESFWLVEGECTAVFFDRAGAATKAIGLGTGAGAVARYYRVEPGIFHTLLIASEWLVFHEVTTGPFVQSEALFPSWAPDGEDEGEVRQYLSALRLEVGE